MGDFNLDLLNTDLHSATNKFMNAFFSHFLYLLISRPTRLTWCSATLIDNIFIQTIFLPRVTMDLLLTICLTIYQSSHSVTLIHSSTIKPKESVAICNFSSQNINNAFNNLVWIWLEFSNLCWCQRRLQWVPTKIYWIYNKSFPIKFC